MIVLKLALCLLIGQSMSLPKPAGGVGGVGGGHGGDHYNEKPDPSTSSMECMMTSIIRTLVKKGLVMKLVISRENIMYTFLMEGSSMSSTMLMATMVVLSWRSNMME